MFSSLEDVKIGSHLCMSELAAVDLLEIRLLIDFTVTYIFFSLKKTVECKYPS